MSGAIIAGAVIAGASAAASVYSSNKQAKAQRRAMEQQERLAKAEAEKAQQAERRQNANQADVGSILAQNMDSALSGGSTLLTGAGGVSNKDLTLGGGNKLG